MLIVPLGCLCFVHSGEDGAAAFEHETEPTKPARAGLAYAHGIMDCGAFFGAVAIEANIAHLADPAHLPAVVIAVARRRIVVAGNALALP